MDKENKICRENWSYDKVKEILNSLSNKEINVVKDDSNMLIIQTLSVKPFQELFISSRTLKKGEDNSSSCDWCYCSNDVNWAIKTYNRYTKNGKNQQYIAFDFTKEFSKDNGCVVAFTVENSKITWSHVMNNTITKYVKNCNQILIEGKPFKSID
jgi:hypothetical protein